MRRVNINIALVATFVLLLAVAVFFESDRRFELAKKLENDYRWRKAAEEYKRTVNLSPFNAKYLAAYADFLARQSMYCKNEISWLEKAEKLYKRALQLNPRCAKYYVRLGEIQISITHSTRHVAHSAKTYVDKAFEDFTNAVANDPNGFNTAYSIGYTGMSVWNFLDEKQKELVLDRLRYGLRLKSWHGKYIYPQVWQYTKNFKLLQKITPNTLDTNRCLYYFVTGNDLWEFYTTQKKVIDFYMKKEKPAEFAREKEDKERLLRSLRSLAITGELENWTGESRDGKNVYENGNMYWTGMISRTVDLYDGASMIQIEARGSQADDIWPYMIVELDGEEIGEIFVDSADWKDYSFKIDTDGGIKVLSVTFANDGANAIKEEDRNLYIGNVKITKND